MGGKKRSDIGCLHNLRIQHPAAERVADSLTKAAALDASFTPRSGETTGDSWRRSRGDGPSSCG